MPAVEPSGHRDSAPGQSPSRGSSTVAPAKAVPGKAGEAVRPRAIPDGGSAGQTVPGTDYPITPWVAVVLGLAGLAVVARLVVMAREHRGSIRSG